MLILLLDMHFIFVPIVLLLSKCLSLVKVVFVILVAMFMFKIEPLNFLLNLLTVIIATLFLLFLKSFVSSFVKIVLLFIYFLKLLHKPSYLGLLPKTKRNILSLALFLHSILLGVILNGILIFMSLLLKLLLVILLFGDLLNTFLILCFASAFKLL